jgi:hypothetical protein
MKLDSHNLNPFTDLVLVPLVSYDHAEINSSCKYHLTNLLAEMIYEGQQMGKSG